MVTVKQVRQFSEKRARPHVVVIGDVILDEYIFGDVLRISPEAPVPIVSVTKKKYSLGGAANVAKNLSALGAQVSLFGVVGDDINAKKFFTALHKENISNDNIVTCKDRKTCTKTRIIGHGQQMLRIDDEVSYMIDIVTVGKILAGLSNGNGADAIIFSDYSKGTLHPDIVRKAKMFENNPIIAVDTHVWDDKYKGTTVITPNIDEARSFAEVPTTAKIEQCYREFASELYSKTKCKYILTTLHEKGMFVYDSTCGSFHSIDSYAQEVYDVTGAGDTVISAFVIGLLAGFKPSVAADFSNCAAAISVSRLGATAVTLSEISNFIEGGN
jgi:rfaE bifunctional protein kinase chain/domain